MPVSVSFIYYCTVQDFIWEEWVKINGKAAKKGVKGGDKRQKPKKKKTQGAPKKNLSSYMMFCSEERGKKDLNGTPKEQAQELGRRWQALNEGEKMCFTEKANLDLKRYQEQLKQYKANNETVQGGVGLEGEGDCGDSSEKQDSGSAGLEEQGVGLDEHEGGEVEVEIVVTFKEDRKVIQAKESTTIGKIKEKLAMYYKKNCEGLLLKIGSTCVSDDFTAGSFRGETLVLEDLEALREGSSQPGDGETNFEARIGRFMGVFDE